MTSLDRYLDNIKFYGADADTVGDVGKALGLVLKAQKTLLDAPKKIETTLRDPTKALDIPTVIKVPLSVAPFGIGTAIKAVDRIADETREVILGQADAMKALDTAWTLPKTLVNTAIPVNTLNNAFITSLKLSLEARGDEAAHIAFSLEGDLPTASRLGARLETFNAEAEAWFAARDGFIAPLQDALDQLEALAGRLAALMPDLDILDTIAAGVQSIFGPIAGAFSGIEDALCKTLTITPRIPAVYITVFGERIQITPEIPAVTVNVCNVLENIGNAVGIVQNFVEDVITGALGALGFDLLGVVNDLKDKLLSPFDPIFDALADLLSGFQPIIDALRDAVDAMGGYFDDLMAELRDLIDVPVIFEHASFGDEAAGLIDFADELIGSAEEDGLFGLKGDDTLMGLAGDDFLFGAEGDDSLDGGEGADEIYGGAGADRMVGDLGGDAFHGGGGVDTVVYAAALAGVRASLATGGTGGEADGDSFRGVENLIGSKFGDRLSGDASGNRIEGGGGRDVVMGGRGGDRITGDGGNDQLMGEAGRDIILAGAGRDRVDGGAGGDQLHGGGQRDVLIGGGGRDRLMGEAGRDRLEGGRGNDIYDGGAGADRLVFAAREGVDRVIGFEDGRDRFEIESGAERFAQLRLQASGDDVLVKFRGTTIIIEDVAMDDIGRSDFIFT